MNKLFVGLIFAVLAGCGGGGGSDSGGNAGPVQPPAPTGAVQISCSSLYNDMNACAPAATATRRALAVDAQPQPEDMGVVSRTGQVWTYTVVDNTTATPYAGFLDIVLHVDCGNGLPDWHVVQAQHFTVQPGKTFVYNVGFGCAAASLGDHLVDVTVFDADGTTVRDKRIGRVTIVE